MMHHLTFSYNVIPPHCLPSSRYLENDLIPQYRRRKRINAFCPWVRFFNNESVEELQSMVVDGVAAVMIAQFLIPPNLPSTYLLLTVLTSIRFFTIIINFDNFYFTMSKNCQN